MSRLEELLPRLTRVVTVLAMLFIVVMAAFFTANIPDTPFHMQRIQFIADNFSVGGSWRLYTSALGGYGYGAPLFYGDVLMYPFALLRACGVDLLLCFRLMTVVCLASVLLVARYVFRQMMPPGDAADVATMVYVVMPPILRQTVGWNHGMMLALIFMPVALLGLYRILCQGAGVGSPRGWLLLALGVTGLLLSHLLSSVMLFCMLAVIVAIYIRSISREQVMSIVLAAVVCLSLSAWFVVPMLEQMMTDKFFVTSAEIPLGKWRMADSSVPLVGWFFPPKALRMLGFEVNDFESMGMLSCVVALAIIIWYQRRELVANRFMLALAVITAFCVWEQSSFFPHDLCQAVHGVFQFPSRVAGVALLCTSLLVGWFYARARRRLTVLPILLVVCYFFATYSFGEVIRVVSGEGFARAGDANSYIVSNAEFMPAKAYVWGERIEDDMLWQDAIVERGESVVVSSAGNDSIEASCRRDGYKTIVDYAGGEGQLRRELPLVYYKGYRAALVESGDELLVAESEHGLLEVQTTKGSGQIEVYYAGTWLQSLAAVYSVVVAVVLVGYVVVVRRRRRCYGKE